MLRNGKFIAEGSPKEIKEKYQVDSVEEAFIVAGKTLEMKAKEVVRSEEHTSELQSQR